jgi:hypothetical protein
VLIRIAHFRMICRISALRQVMGKESFLRSPRGEAHRRRLQ